MFGINEQNLEYDKSKQAVSKPLRTLDLSTTKRKANETRRTKKKERKYLHIKVQEFGAGKEMKIKNLPLYLLHTLRVHKNVTTQKHTP
jgi:uncharacterized protein YlxW (UPF0749 family)